MNLRVGGRRRVITMQEIKVATEVGLSDTLLIERAKAARVMRRGLLPVGTPAREMGRTMHVPGGNARLRAAK